ncbi:MAG: alpha/beta hydrolase [Burkholderiales bacterium PBB5]|nr:MAG: alpha/beta hydrolase [Burkholderiales bacterium PBB5]
MPAVADAPQLHHTQANGLSLASFEWRAARRGQGATLWLVHATGFHGRVWDEVVHRLPDRHVIAVEQRGHGRSQAAHFDSWAPFGDDQAALARAFGLQGAVGVGHSMGAHALVQAAAAVPGAFSRLILIDPVLLAPADYLHPPVPAGTLHPAAQRKHHFDSPQAMAQRFAARPPYSVFTTQALQDYCQHGLRPADGGQGGYQLCCAPAVEGQVYPLARNQPGIYASIRALDIPVQVVRARAQDPSVLPWDPMGSPTWPGLAGEFRHGQDIHWADRSHMVPMEDPARVAELIGQALTAAGAGPSQAG